MSDFTLEQRLEAWERQSGTRVTWPERQFISAMRDNAKNGVGYGWMQQVIEWEWQSKGPGAWGPAYHEARIGELESLLTEVYDQVDMVRGNWFERAAKAIGLPDADGGVGRE